MLTLWGEAKSSRWGERGQGGPRGNSLWDAKSTVPVVLLERCVLPRHGRLFGNFGESKEDS